MDGVEQYLRAAGSAGSIAIEVFDRLPSDPEAAELLAREIVARESGAEPDVRAQALLALGWCRLCNGASAEAVALADEALALLERDGNRAAKARAYQLLAGAHHAEGEHGAGFRAARRAAALHDLPPMSGEEHAKKLRAVARIGGGIAHDVKNMIAAIVGYADLALESGGEESPSAPALRSILRAAGRARDLLREVLLFSRRVERKLEVMRLQPVLREAAEMVGPRIRGSIRLETDIDPAVGPVRADGGQVHRIVSNLLANACDALAQSGGRVTLSLEEVQVDASLAASLPNLEPGRHVVVRVADDGPGMTEEVQRRIFEPHFSTWTNRCGHGLGLNVVQSLVIGHGGDLAVESAPGRGAVFSVYLRRASEG